jgi:hypothetical protein
VKLNSAIVRCIVKLRRPLPKEQFWCAHFRKHLSHQPEGERRLSRIAAAKTNGHLSDSRLADMIQYRCLSQASISDHKQGAAGSSQRSAYKSRALGNDFVALPNFRLTMANPAAVRSLIQCVYGLPRRSTVGTSPRGNDELEALFVIQPKCLSDAIHGVAIGVSAQATLQVRDPTPAEPSAIRQRRLTQAGGDAEPSQ